MREGRTSFDVLLVEDDLADAGLVRMAIERGRHVCRIHHVKDGTEALAFLRRIGGANSQAPRPDLVLLDLNLPGRSGHEVLEEVKADSSLRAIPVVVLSTSGAGRDVARAYLAGANSFISKPMEVEEFMAAIHAIQHYWFDLCAPPG